MSHDDRFTTILSLEPSASQPAGYSPVTPRETQHVLKLMLGAVSVLFLALTGLLVHCSDKYKTKEGQLGVVQAVMTGIWTRVMKLCWMRKTGVGRQ